MADLSDVENAIVNAIVASVYPNGTSAPSAIVVGSTAYPCKVYGGWPEPDDIDADMVATPPVVNISVYAMPGMERNTTRFPREWFNQFLGTPTITATLSGVEVEIGGAITVGQYVSILIGRQNAYSYAAKAGDTLSSFAANLAAMIPIASVDDDVITLPLTAQGLIKVRVGAPGTIIQELERTNQLYMVSIWTPNNPIRVAASKIIRPALADIDYLNFPDATVGRLLYDSSHDISAMQKQNVYRRDIRYWVEYATCIEQPGFPITIFQTQITVPGEQAPDEFTVNS